MSGGGELLCLGISHKTAPVAVRERLALTTTSAQELCRELVASDAIREAVAISTCNRTEIYLVGDPVAAETELLGRLAQRADTRPTELADTIYAPRNCDAARQLFRVVSGLESMIVGEAEIQGQAKRAYEAALAAQTTGPLTNRLFTAALQTGRRVRSETSIGAGRTSVSTVAVDLAKDVVGHLAEREVLIIGAGETSELTAQALASEGVATIFVANRHADRARSLAERFGGTVLSLDHLPRQLETADIVVASTSSPHALVSADALAEVVRARAGRPIVLIDLAVPRDIDPECADLPGVSVYDMDDLQAVVARNLEVRSEEAVRAERVVEDEIQRFAKWLGQLDVVPTVAALRRRGDELVESVLAENAQRWESLSDRDRERVEKLARAIAQRLLHEPTLRIKAAGGHGRLQLARELFGLDTHASPDGELGAGPDAGAPVADSAAEVVELDERRAREQ
jgi:glutamyl-tRNA reductase